MRNHIQRIVLSWFVYFLIIPSYAAPETNMSYGMIRLTPELYTFHRMIFYICSGIAIIVLGILLYSLVKLRYSNNNTHTYFHKYLTTDIFWTILPFFILIAFILPAVKLLL